MKELEFHIAYVGAWVFNFLTIRNMKGILLGECILNVYGFQFHNLWQVQSISAVSYANLPKQHISSKH